MKRSWLVVLEIKRSVMLALLVLPLLFSSLGAWEVWRRATMRAEIAELAGEHRNGAGTVRD